MIWVGFELLLHSCQLGISATRAEWLTKMGEGGGKLDIHPHEQVRRKIRQDCTCRGCFGVRAAVSRAALQIPHHPPSGLSAQSASLCRFDSEVYGPPSGEEQALPLRVRDDLIRSCTQSRRASER